MVKLLATLLLLLGSALPLMAGADVPQGAFKVVNTEGFVQADGLRTPIAADTAVGSARIQISENDGLSLTINGTHIALFPLENGLAALDWNAEGTSLLRAIDIQALRDKADGKDVPAWGASLVWPEAGDVQLILLPLGGNAFTGFLISRPGDRTVVRQMEFRKVFGPANRPLSKKESRKSGS